MAKRVVKKSASKKPSRPKPSTMSEKVVPDALQNPEANHALVHQKVESKPAKRIAKVVNLIISVGDDDRGRSFDKMVEDIKKAVGARQPPFVDEDGNRLPGPHVAVTGGYYILDGKVCRPEDYDPKKRNFKPGTFPPSWAGGPATSTAGKATGYSAQQQIDYDLANLSADEYDKKYQLGKYAPKPSTAKIITPEMQKQKLEEWKRDKARREEAELEEFDWDEEDVHDDKKMGKVADKSASDAVARMKKGKKRVVKKPAAPKPQKKVVRRVKK